MGRVNGRPKMNTKNNPRFSHLVQFLGWNGTGTSLQPWGVCTRIITAVHAKIGYNNVKQSTEETITLPQVHMTHVMLTLLSHCETSCNSRNRRLKLASRYYTNNNMSSMLITQLVLSLTDKGKKQYVANSSYSIIQVELARQMSWNPSTLCLKKRLPFSFLITLSKINHLNDFWYKKCGENFKSTTRL